MDASFVRGRQTVIVLRRGGSRIGWRRRQLRYPIGWVAWMKGADRLIYAVVGTRRGGGGGGGGKIWGACIGCCSGVRFWGVLFGVRLSCMSGLPIGVL